MSYPAGKFAGEVLDAGFETIEKGEWQDTPILKIAFKVIAQWSDDEDGFVELDSSAQYQRELSLFFGEKGKATEARVRRAIDDLQEYFGWRGTKLENAPEDILGAQFECINKPEGQYDRFSLPGGGGSVTIKKNKKAGASLGRRFNKLIKVPKSDSRDDKPVDDEKPEDPDQPTSPEDDDEVPF